MKVTPGFLSFVFAGKKKLPMERLADVAKALAMDEASQKVLRKALLVEWVHERQGSLPMAEELLKGETRVKPSSLETREERPTSEFSVLQKWYLVAILDLVTCADFNEDPCWIADRLSISEEQAAEGFALLLEKGLLEKRGQHFVKVDEKIRYPTTKSIEAIREYHKMMITKALQTMLLETDDISFEKRLITSVSFALNQQKLKAGKERIMELIFEIADILSEGECTEVYQLNVQLYPLTRRDQPSASPRTVRPRAEASLARGVGKVNP